MYLRDAYYAKSNTLENPRPLLRLNHHKKDANNPKVIPTYSHYKIHGHNVMKYVKFTLIEQLTEISNVSKNTLRLRLKRREGLWIIKLETLAPKD